MQHTTTSICQLPLSASAPSVYSHFCASPPAFLKVQGSALNMIWFVEFCIKATSERHLSFRSFCEAKRFLTDRNFQPLLKVRYFCCIENLTPNIYWQKCNKYNCRLTLFLVLVVEKEITEGKKSYIKHLNASPILQKNDSLINTWKLTLSVQKVTNLMSTF